MNLLCIGLLAQPASNSPDLDVSCWYESFTPLPAPFSGAAMSCGASCERPAKERGVSRAIR